MSFNFIIEPATLESYSIFSKEGVALLKKYVKDYQTGGADVPDVPINWAGLQNHDVNDDDDDDTAVGAVGAAGAGKGDAGAGKGDAGADGNKVGA